MYINRGYGSPKTKQQQFWEDCEKIVRKRELKKAIRKANKKMYIEVAFWISIYILIIGYVFYEKTR